MKNTLRHVALGLGVSTFAVLLAGCARYEDPSMGMTGGMEQRPYTPNFFDAVNSDVQYFQNPRTTLVDGYSPLTENTYRLTDEQRYTIEQVQRHREMIQELSW